MWVIVNPQAGRGRGAAAARWMAGWKPRGKPAPEVLLTEGPGHARELAGKALAVGVREVVVVGGDGTVGEVAEVLRGTEATMGIVPVGTGNDLARSVGVPLGTLGEALAVVEWGRRVVVDVGIDGQRAFVSVLGLGFPAAVARRVNGFRRLRGALAFTWGVYRELIRMRPFSVTLRLDDDPPFETTATSVLVQNTPSTGGGMKTAPGAVVDDGYLDVVVVTDIGRAALMWNFPKVYRGRHLSHPCFQAYRCRTAALDCPRRVEKMGDGEDWGWSPVSVHVEPRTLNVFVHPARSRCQ